MAHPYPVCSHDLCTPGGSGIQDREAAYQNNGADKRPFPAVAEENRCFGNACGFVSHALPDCIVGLILAVEPIIEKHRWILIKCGIQCFLCSGMVRREKWYGRKADCSLSSENS